MNRIPLLLAVLEKWGALSLAKCDIFVSAAGGVEVGEPAADLGIVVSVASALRNRAVDGATVFLGEVGLGGEVRGVARAERRLREASRLGFRRAFIPMDNLTPDVRAQGEIAVEGVEYIRDVLDAVLPVKKE
jgi:DNA repair protein RadA/Sms